MANHAIFHAVLPIRLGSDTPSKCGFDSRCPLIIVRSALFLCGRLLAVTEPHYVFAYYVASFYKGARSSEFWIEYANIGRECCQKSTKICYSIVFERCLAHGFRRELASGSCCS